MVQSSSTFLHLQEILPSFFTTPCWIGSGPSGRAGIHEIAEMHSVERSPLRIVRSSSGLLPSLANPRTDPPSENVTLDHTLRIDVSGDFVKIKQVMSTTENILCYIYG